MAKKIKGKGSDGKEVEIEVEDAENPGYVTAEEFDAKLNAAITGHFSRFETKLGKLLDTRLAGAPKGGESDPADKGKGKEAGGGETDARLKALQDQLATERKAREDADKAREDADTRRKNGEKSRSLAAALSDAGVSASLREAAQALLESKGFVQLSEDGAVVFKTTDKYGNERAVPLKDGLGEWFKDEGKAFVPAKGAGGSGAPGPSRAPSGPSKGRTPTKDEEKIAQKEAAARDLVLALHGLPPEAQS